MYTESRNKLTYPNVHAMKPSATYFGWPLLYLNCRCVSGEFIPAPYQYHDVPDECCLNKIYPNQNFQHGCDLRSRFLVEEEPFVIARVGPVFEARDDPKMVIYHLGPYYV